MSPSEHEGPQENASAGSFSTGAEFARWAAEQPKLETPLELNRQPVGIEEGREAVRNALDALAEVPKLTADLPMGERTRHFYAQALTELSEEPDAILVNQTRGAHYRVLAVYNGMEMSDPLTGRSTIDVGLGGVEGVFRGWTAQAFERAGIQADDEFIRDITYKWTIWHETGHALQAAYIKASLPPGQDRTSANLEDDALAAGVSEPYMKRTDFVDRVINSRVESERFAEGFGQMLVERYLVDRLGWSPEVAQHVREQLTPDSRKQAMEQAQSAIARYNELDDHTTSFSQLKTYLLESGLPDGDTGRIGYGSPYAPEQVNRILQITP